MKKIANAVVGFVALSHLGFLLLEMFLWDHPIGRKMFDMTAEFSATTAVLAANQGLYNGFLAAGLIWALHSGRRDLKLFFLGCVTAAGLFGGMSASTTILFIQGLPALIGMLLVWKTPQNVQQSK